ncbi:MAG: FAD-binding oxidoreductase [Desulfobacterales bacterium]|nr:FAD-binding oxidoreductase [Desulfobacterales bacterium]
MSKVQFKEIPYWLDPHPTTKSYSKKELSQKTDVLVIGSGFAGMSTALHLRKAGIEVTVLEKGKIGSEASSKNGGMSITGPAKGFVDILKKFGEEPAIRMFRESMDAIDCIEENVKEGNIDCHFARCGHFAAAFKPSHLDHLKKVQELEDKHLNHKTILFSKAQMHDEIGTDFYHGGLVDPLSVGVHPAKYIAGLVRMADDAGADLHENTSAGRIEKNGNTYIVHTNRGQIQSNNIAICTNGYTGKLTPWLQRRIVPFESFMIATEELPPDVAKAISPKNRMMFDTKNRLFYFRLSPDGKRMLFGPDPQGFNKSFKDKVYTARKEMVAIFPQLEKFDIEYAWAGNCGMSYSFFPSIGQHDGLYYAVGYSGHGISFASYLGKKLAGLIATNKVDTMFSELKFKAIPLYNGKPWFIPFVDKFFRFLDVIG